MPTKREWKEGAHPHERILTVEPFFPGYGTTVGNALRRVLLSSLTGAAVTAVKFKGATHEFTTLPNVKEDVLEIILNLKQLRLKLFSDEPVKLTLHAVGDRKVTAKDISPSADVQIANPKLHIATITDAKGELDLEITVARGRGYLPTEERGKEKLELGTIAVDAFFSPVRNVGYKVENVRVGDITNFDRLILVVETDGTIAPEDAVVDASKILLGHFELLTQIVDAVEAAPPVVEEAETPAVPIADAPSTPEPKKKRVRKAKV